MNLERLKSDLVRHEGLRLKPYLDTVGKLTIGVGRNLTDNGISSEEAIYLLDNDIAERLADPRLHGILEGHDDVRQEVLINMSFMGVEKLLGFKKMLIALRDRDYDEAANQMLDSRWARQVKGRAVELAKRMKTGEEE